MTGSAADDLIMQPHIRNKPRRRAIEKRFKDASDPLKLAIVRDIWLTGFDVSSLHTMYVDKPMKGHSLVQAISRVNRGFKTKAGGLVVDYFGIADDPKRALATYIDSGGSGEPVLPEKDAVGVLQRDYEVVRALFHKFPYQGYLDGDTARKMIGLNKGADHILGLEDGKARYFDHVRASLRHSRSLRPQTMRAVLATRSHSSKASGRRLSRSRRRVVRVWKRSILHLRSLCRMQSARGASSTCSSRLESSGLTSRYFQTIFSLRSRAWNSAISRAKCLSGATGRDQGPLPSKCRAGAQVLGNVG